MDKSGNNCIRGRYISWWTRVEVPANTVSASTPPRRELDDIGIVINPVKSVVQPPKEHAPTAEEIQLLESVDVLITEEGGVTVLGVPIGTEEYVVERAVGVVRGGGVERLARCVADMEHKQAAALVAIKSVGQKASYLEHVLDTGMPPDTCRMADNGVQ